MSEGDPYVVEQRTREVGLRLALGAAPISVQRMVLSQVLTTTMVGVMVGFAIAAGFGRVLSTVLFDVSPLDAQTICGVAVLLVTTTLLAGYRPAKRASRVDPAIVLRSE
jgi:putative ABC transport system permease protein